MIEKFTTAVQEFFLSKHDNFHLANSLISYRHKYYNEGSVMARVLGDIENM